LTRGLDPTDKAVRVANYISGLRGELVRLSHAMGAEHPSLVDPAAVERQSDGVLTPLLETLGYEPGLRP
jgi:hypothetical protein